MQTQHGVSEIDNCLSMIGENYLKMLSIGKSLPYSVFMESLDELGIRESGEEHMYGLGEIMRYPVFVRLYKKGANITLGTNYKFFGYTSMGDKVPMLKDFSENLAIEVKKLEEFASLSKSG